MLLFIIIVYLVIGIIYAVTIFNDPPTLRPLLATENPLAFFIVSLFSWPLLIARKNNQASSLKEQWKKTPSYKSEYKAKTSNPIKPSTAPKAPKTLSTKNVINFLQNQAVSTLSKQELILCSRYLSQLQSQNTEELRNAQYERMMHGGPDPDMTQMETIRKLQKEVMAELDHK